MSEISLQYLSTQTFMVLDLFAISGSTTPVNLAGHQYICTQADSPLTGPI